MVDLVVINLGSSNKNQAGNPKVFPVDTIQGVSARGGCPPPAPEGLQDSKSKP